MGDAIGELGEGARVGGSEGDNGDGDEANEDGGNEKNVRLGD